MVQAGFLHVEVRKLHLEIRELPQAGFGLLPGIDDPVAQAKRFQALFGRTKFLSDAVQSLVDELHRFRSGFRLALDVIAHISLGQRVGKISGLLRNFRRIGDAHDRNFLIEGLHIQSRKDLLCDQCLIRVHHDFVVIDQLQSRLRFHQRMIQTQDKYAGRKKQGRIETAGVLHSLHRQVIAHQISGAIQYLYGNAMVEQTAVAQAALYEKRRLPIQFTLTYVTDAVVRGAEIDQAESLLDQDR